MTDLPARATIPAVDSPAHAAVPGKSGNDSTPPARRSEELALWLLVGLGIAIRLVQLLAARPLWLDEASLSLNLLARRFGTVVRGGLDFHESGPPAFLAGQWLAARIFGPNEIALRALPFAAGAGFLFALRKLARALEDRTAALWTLAAAAVSPVLIYYGNEAKQYAVEACATAVLLAIALPLIEGRGSAPRATALLLAGIAAITLSSAAIMTLAAITAALIISGRMRRPGPGLVFVGIAAAIWIGAFVLVYELCYRDYARDPYNLRYWTTRFVDLGRPGAFRRTLAAAAEVCGSFFVTGAAFRGIAQAVVAIAAIVLIGFVVLARRRGLAIAVALAGTCAAPFVLSALGRLPITPRVMLFAVAPLFVAFGSGLSALARVVPRAARAAAVVVLFAVSLLRPALLAGRWTAHPPRTENAPPIVADIEDYRLSREPVYVGARGAPAWLIYSTDWKTPDRARLAWYLDRIGSSGPAFENAPSRGGPVVDEGRDLVWTPADGGVELLGTPTGRQSLASGFVRPSPDPGWAENEAQRIRAAANPTIWLFFSHVDRSQDDLLAALEREGGKLIARHPENGADAYRFRF